MGCCAKGRYEPLENTAKDIGLDSTSIKQDFEDINSNASMLQENNVYILDKTKQIALMDKLQNFASFIQNDNILSVALYSAEKLDFILINNKISPKAKQRVAQQQSQTLQESYQDILIKINSPDIFVIIGYDLIQSIKDKYLDLKRISYFICQKQLGIHWIFT